MSFDWEPCIAIRCDKPVSTVNLSPWLIGAVRAEPETVISRAWVQSPDLAE